MKKIVLVIVAMFTLGAFTASAQKISYLDYIQVMDSLDTFKTAIAKSEEVQLEFEATMQYLQEDYQKKAIDYQNQMDSLPEILRQMREKELYDIQALSEQKQAEYQASLQTIQERYFVPLEKWLKEAVAIVGKAKGLDYILYYDEENSIFWVNLEKAVDVTNVVITEMLRLEKENPITTPGG